MRRTILDGDKDAVTDEDSHSSIMQKGPRSMAVLLFGMMTVIKICIIGLVIIFRMIRQDPEEHGAASFVVPVDPEGTMFNQTTLTIKQD